MAEEHENSRLEAFSDGVFAIALTLLIIDIKIPSSTTIETTNDLWLALKHLLPAIFAFVLSFIIILITWVNHRANLKLIRKSSAAFIYANGFLLLVVVAIPFPTALLGEHLLTDHAAPAVVLYDSVLAIQALSWILIAGAALNNRLARDEKSILTIRKNSNYGYYAFVFYFVCAITAFWFPLTIAIVTAVTWIFWLILGINTKHE